MQLFKLPKFDFSHPIVNLIVELEKLRNNSIMGTTPANIFFLIKRLFHILESVSSARIEGNNTTISEYVLQIENQDNISEYQEDILEIRNIDLLLSDLDDMGEQINIDNFFIKQLHSCVVKGLRKEGSRTPGTFRINNVRINNSSHTPPDASKIEEYMNKLIDFINHKDSPQYDLIKIAMIHHAFAWIHPFDNGNGRVVRALTYALMLKYGFKIDAVGRVMNPVAVFCTNRSKYYDMLQKADDLSNDGILVWCTYVLEAIRSEYNKTLKLTQYKFVLDKLIYPTIKNLSKSAIINNTNDINILEKIITSNNFKKADILPFCTNDIAATRKINELKEKNLIVPIKEGSKIYQFNLSNSIFLRLIGAHLAKEGFLPELL